MPQSVTFISPHAAFQLTLEPQLPVTSPTGTTSFTRDPTGRLIGERRPDGRYYYLFDGLGSITGLTNSTGALVRTYRYEPYGTQRETTGTGPQAALRFASGYLMPGGVYHFGQRYMSPATGRWTQQDPLDQPSDLREGNRYIYAGDDPVNLVDPAGLVGCATFGLGGICKTVRRVATSSPKKLVTTVGGVAVIAGSIGTGLICEAATRGTATEVCVKIGAIGVATGGILIASGR